MCGIGLATKGVICRGRDVLVGVGGGGVVYRDRKPSKFKFPKVDAELIEIISTKKEDFQVKISLVETIT